MSTTIPKDIVKRIKDRRALLWVCQGYDLVKGVVRHDYDEPPQSAALRYRADPNETDLKFARLFWEGVWLEGAASPLLWKPRLAQQRGR